MKAHVLQHVPFEGLGSIGAWLNARDAAVTWTRFFDSADLPPPGEPDLIVALGGPMSVNDEAELSWLADEKRFLRGAVEAGTPVLGICLGAQLIANALGAPVGPGREPEIGWFDIEATSADSDTFRFPDRSRVFHWHGESFGLPDGAIRLARSPACDNQAFQLGDRIVGLQFHLETTPASLDAIVTNCRDELVDGRFIQSEAEMRDATPDAFTAINRMMDTLLDYLMRGMGR